MHINTDCIYSTTVEFTYSSVPFYFNSLRLCLQVLCEVLEQHSNNYIFDHFTFLLISLYM